MPTLRRLNRSSSRRTSTRALVWVFFLFLGIGAFTWWLEHRQVSESSAPPVVPGRPSDSAPANPDSADPTPSGSIGSGSIGSGSTGTGSALATLAEITIRAKEPSTGYSRTAFSPGWLDPDGNGCDARNDVLRRDLTDVVIRPGTNGCIVASGRLTDPYTGRTASFQRGTNTSGLINIDHVVALGNAWRTGAAHWDAQRRVEFYNDPLELLAVFDTTNADKNGSDAETWLPPKPAARCAYVARVVAIKSSYGLWMTQAEHDAIHAVLLTCPEQGLPT